MAAKGKRMAEEPKKHREQEQVDYNKYQKNGEIPMSENDYKYGAYERNMERAEEYQIKRKKKMNKGLKIFLIILLVLVILIAAAGTAGYTFVNGKLNKMQQENIDTTAVGINEDTKKITKAIKNIWLPLILKL